MANYKLTLEAKEDLRRIYLRGIADFGAAQADKYFHQFLDKFEEIALNPLAYQSADTYRKGYRRAVCGVDSIFYRTLNDGTPEIMAIIGRQDVEEWL